MSKREYKKQRERIRALISEWHDVLGLWSWEVRHHYYHGQFKKIGPNTESRDALAATYADWKYLYASVQWNLKMVVKQNDAALREVFVHEMMHIYLAEVRMTGKMSNEERIATELSRAFVRVKERASNG